MKWKKTMILILRWGFGGLLLAAALPKIAQPLLFTQAVENYRVFGPALSRWAAVWIPWLELITGLSMISGMMLAGGIIINAGLMGAFLVLVIQARIRGLDISCGCFEVEGGDPITWLKILENVGFFMGSCLLGALLFLPGPHSEKHQDSPSSKS